MITDDILFAPVRELANQIRAGKLSPVELAEAYLERLEKIGPKLGAVVTVTRELALKEAKAAEREIAAGKYRGQCSAGGAGGEAAAVDGSVGGGGGRE